MQGLTISIREFCYIGDYASQEGEGTFPYSIDRMPKGHRKVRHACLLAGERMSREIEIDIRREIWREG